MKIFLDWLVDFTAIFGLIAIIIGGLVVLYFLFKLVFLDIKQADDYKELFENYYQSLYERDCKKLAEEYRQKLSDKSKEYFKEFYDEAMKKKEDTNV